MKPHRIWPILLAAIVSGVLMGLRGEFSSIWVRTSFAAAAGMALGLGLWLAGHPGGDKAG